METGPKLKIRRRKKITLKNGNQKKKNNKKRIIIIVSVILAIIACLAIVGVLALNSAKSLKKQASEAKRELQVSMECIKAQDYEGAYTAINNAEELTKSMQSKLNQPIWKVASITPGLGSKISTVKELLSVLQTASQDVIEPLITQMKENPIAGLKNENGFNVGILLSYVNYADGMDSKITNLVSKVDDLMPKMDGIIDLIDKEGKFAKYKDQMMGLSDQYNQLKAYLPMFKTFLGNGENRFYLLVAQNSSEIRAAGGFPGSVGTIQIQDGYLKVGDFQSVYKVLSNYAPKSAGINENEKVIFDDWIKLPRDAVYDPDFSRVADIWALSYESKTQIHVNGVVSLSPTIIQDMLSLCGEITLSDGTVLNSNNATRVLQYDLYYKYFSKDVASEQTNDMADALFAETAKKTMDLFESNFNFKEANHYFSIFSNGAQSRRIMMWMENEQEENIMIASGCSGVLNTGRNNAIAGVYFSCNDPQKLGWYLDINTEIGDVVTNADGTHTYDVKVILNNTISNEDISKASAYILGSFNGAMRGYVHLFAPTGGTIFNFKTNNNMKMVDGYYQGLELGYCLDMKVYPNKPVEITYKVTTAADVTDPLTISATPTLQNYR